MFPVPNISRKARIAGTFLKVGVILSCCLGISLQLQAGSGGFMTAQSLFKYFTIQSNAWIALACLGLLLVDWLAPARRVPLLLTIKFMFTVSILLTFTVFTVLLAPLMPRSYLLSPSNFFLHSLTAILATADYLICDYHHQSPRSHVLLGLIMPFLYLVIALAASINGVRFGGQRVPYFSWITSNWAGFGSAARASVSSTGSSCS